MILIKDKQLLYKIIRHGPERLVLPIWARLSRDSALRWLYKRRMGVMLNYDNPQTFSEKIQWMKVFWDHPLKVKCADKFCVREYVTECGCEEILVDMLGVYENPDEIDFNSLPERFVLKANHGSAMNLICVDKGTLDTPKTKRILNQWLRTQQAFRSIEPQYEKIKRKIICEAYIDDGINKLPTDYKVYCFNGQPKYIMAISDRDNSIKKIIYDLDWNPTDFTKDEYSIEDIHCKPRNLEKMLHYAEKLSAPFPFVRADFYDTGERVYFGELTFTPMAGFNTNLTPEAQYILGSLIELPEPLLNI